MADRIDESLIEGLLEWTTDLNTVEDGEHVLAFCEDGSCHLVQRAYDPEKGHDFWLLNTAAHDAESETRVTIDEPILVAVVSDEMVHGQRIFDDMLQAGYDAMDKLDLEDA